jgi:hypothetical protein
VRAIPDPGFAGDDGSVPAAVTEALAAYDADPEGRFWAALGVLQDARVLVPVVAVRTEMGHGEVEVDEQGLRREKTSDMAAVLMQGQDGRTALLAFTGTAALQRWRPDARPVPVTLRQAARAALDDGAAALVVDVAGPVLFVVEDDALRSLAAGHRLVEVAGGPAWVQAPPV